MQGPFCCPCGSGRNYSSCLS
ncbi:SEC-C metal-binding domain-containing protein [Treponema sp.]